MLFSKCFSSLSFFFMSSQVIDSYCLSCINHRKSVCTCVHAHKHTHMHERMCNTHIFIDHLQAIITKVLALAQDFYIYDSWDSHSWRPSRHFKNKVSKFRSSSPTTKPSSPLPANYLIIRAKAMEAVPGALLVPHRNRQQTVCSTF